MGTFSLFRALARYEQLFNYSFYYSVYFFEVRNMSISYTEEREIGQERERERKEVHNVAEVGLLLKYV